MHSSLWLFEYSIILLLYYSTISAFYPPCAKLNFATIQYNTMQYNTIQDNIETRNSKLETRNSKLENFETRNRKSKNINSKIENRNSKIEHRRLSFVDLQSFDNFHLQKRTHILKNWFGFFLNWFEEFGGSKIKNNVSKGPSTSPRVPEIIKIQTVGLFQKVGVSSY